jgi:hypothetical protein
MKQSNFTEIEIKICDLYVIHKRIQTRKKKRTQQKVQKKKKENNRDLFWSW